MKFKKVPSGMTLSELLIVITILAFAVGVTVGVMNSRRAKAAKWDRSSQQMADDKRRILLNPFFQPTLKSGVPVPVATGIWYFSENPRVSCMETISFFLRTNLNLEVALTISVEESKVETNIMSGIPHLVCKELGLEKGCFVHFRNKPK